MNKKKKKIKSHIFVIWFIDDIWNRKLTLCSGNVNRLIFFIYIFAHEKGQYQITHMLDIKYWSIISHMCSYEIICFFYLSITREFSQGFYLYDVVYFVFVILILRTIYILFVGTSIFFLAAIMNWTRLSLSSSSRCYRRIMPVRRKKVIFVCLILGSYLIRFWIKTFHLVSFFKGFLVTQEHWLHEISSEN